MSFEAYRVRKQFQWRGWQYAPVGECECSKEQKNEPGSCAERGCTGVSGSSCEACPGEICRCACHILREVYAGDIWIVESGHVRKESMLTNRFATGDASIPPIDELMADPRYRRLVEPPREPAPARKPLKRGVPAVGTVRV